MSDRGTYGPLDRDRHFVIGWGADHLAMRAYGRTVGAVLGPALPAISTAIRTKRAARRWWIGSQGVGGRAEADRPVTEVGQEFFHTVADRERAVATLSTHFRALANDLATWYEANKGEPTATSSAQWIAADVTPTLDEWAEFVKHAGTSWWNKAAVSWDTYENWLLRLRQLRGLARAHGITLQSSEPGHLPKTIWQRGASGKGSEATALLGVLKVGVFAALTVTGAVSLYAIVRDMRARRIA